jgi:hypothetical protein
LVRKESQSTQLYSNLVTGESNSSIPDSYNPLAVNGATNKAKQPFWTSANLEHVPAMADVPDVPKSPVAEDMAPAEIDDGALDAYVWSLKVRTRN